MRVLEVRKHLAVTTSWSWGARWTRWTPRPRLALSSFTLESHTSSGLIKPGEHSETHMCVDSLCEQPFGLWHQHFLDFLGLLGAPGGPGDKDRVSLDFNDELSGNVNK